MSVTPGGLDGPVELHLRSVAGSEDVVEPDVVYVAGGWRGWEYWMAINPYPGNDDELENASVYASHDGLTWSTPDSLRNPVVPHPVGPILHNSDPDLVFVPDIGRMVLFDRAVTGQSNLLRQALSDDGAHWTPMANVLDVPRHGFISPAVVRAPGHRWRLYGLDAGTLGCDAVTGTVTMRRWLGSQTGTAALVGAHWSSAVATNLKAPAGLVLWHLDVIYVPQRQEYWALFPAHAAAEKCAYDDLYVARSRDGISWTTLDAPILRRGEAPFIERSIYRSTLVYDDASAAFKVWFSGLAADYTWHLGYEQFPIRTLAAALDRQAGMNRP